ncbi:LacI family DNA-binding transcriptional regulator [Echinimonas agarilytica]|uniref:LacI family DNA-binding transcriptional regulator n=1 Tax=Echinimonas agarilytica TaxID=1215918 RepID=A0AA42B8M8_9GAMM|nr:LacI family DNA-binding transcriptional regulator [Echinimonas agarilytica]MCM2681129.1 LacI family DNA-binding transcriptional regulator [Echinimonas agarilytica]
MATIRDIAKAAGVSASSVSRVINNGPKVGEETRKKILAIIKEVGYTPNANAQAINDNQKLAVGIVMPNIQQPFFSAMAHGIEQVAGQLNAQIMLHSSEAHEQGEQEAIETLMEHRYQSMVVHSSVLDDEKLIRYAQTIPGFVLMNRHIEAISGQCVWLEDAEGGRLRAKFAFDYGHRKYAIFCSNRADIGAQCRFVMSKQWLIAKGIEEHDICTIIDSPTYQGGRRAVQDLVASGHSFTAILAHNDEMAIGAMSMLEAQGLSTPDDVSVIGYDDLNIAEFTQPQLTTVKYPIEAMAIVATQMALSLNKNQVQESQRKFHPSMVLRSSFCRL